MSRRGLPTTCGEASTRPRSRRDRCGSRCTCSRCRRASLAALDGTSERIFEHGLTLPSGSALTEDEFGRIEAGISERDRRSDAPTTRSSASSTCSSAASALVLSAARPGSSGSHGAAQARAHRCCSASNVPGKDGKVFELVKFRTMLEVDDSRGLVSDDERLTPFGTFLRSTSLDELPTLWNVVKGDMSLVGPRPLLVRYLDRYTLEQARRHEVRPGVTGLAQVSGRNAITWEEKFAKDVEYVDTRSLSLDLRILWRTAAQVLGRARDHRRRRRDHD